MNKCAFAAKTKDYGEDHHIGTSKRISSVYKCIDEYMFKCSFEESCNYSNAGLFKCSIVERCKCRYVQMFIAAFVESHKCLLSIIPMDDYKKKLGFLAEKIKKEAPQTPIQQVQPVKPLPVSADLVEVRFNNWIPRNLKKKIKAYGVQHDISQKDITIQALQDFLKQNGQ